MVGLLILGVALLWISYPAPLPYREPDAGKADASGVFAMFYVKKLSSPYFQGRAPGSIGGARAAEYIAEQFQRLGLRPGGEGGTYYQTVTCKGFELVNQDKRWKPIVKGPGILYADNVLGYIGNDGEKNVKRVIIVSAHYDHLGALGKGYFPGANDNASGVAVLMEVARLLRNMRLSPDNRIVFAAWTLEEEGMLGSAWYADHCSLDKVSAVINLDALGNGSSREFLVWTHEVDSPLLNALADASKKMHIGLNIQKMPEPSPHSSDHLPFSRKGVSAVTI
ncbi:MAG: M20/M25/M40 family metallo-hydrolase, partial [Thermacetogeniaceae bacterium]